MIRPLRVVKFNKLIQYLKLVNLNQKFLTWEVNHCLQILVTSTLRVTAVPAILF